MVKKMISKPIKFCLLVLGLSVSFILVACSIQSPVEPTQEQTLSSETAPNSCEPAVVFIQDYRTNKAVLVAKPLNGENPYAEIPVDSKAKLLSAIRIDQEANLYFAYRSGDNFFVKLLPTGEVERVALPRLLSPQSVWLGNTLVFDSNGNDRLVIVNSDMQIDSAPALSMGNDGNAEFGVLGLSGGKNPMVLWAATNPVRRDGDLYALYRTLDLTSKQIEEKLLPIPNAKTDYLSETENLNDRIHTIVYAVEPENGYTLLCYGKESDESDYRGTYLELYDSAHTEPIMTEQDCCSNNIFRFAGGYFLTDRYYEGCSYNWIRSLQDGSKVIALEKLDNDDDLVWNHVVSNGNSFIYINNKKAYFIDQQGAITREYPTDFEGFPNCWGSEECFGFSFPFFPESETSRPTR